MPIKYIFFDLDGTLLPMDQEKFTKAYFGSLAKKVYPYGYDPNELVSSIWKGCEAMVLNDGKRLNREVFWDVFVSIYGEKINEDYKHFDDYYNNDFDKVQPSCGFNPDTPMLISYLKSKGYKLVLATNPLFPTVATECRIKWAGMKKEDFELVTTYDNFSHSKPNLEYYKDIMKLYNLSPDECMMVGNDVDEDMIASELGMRVYLVTDNLINRKNKDISVYPNGDLKGLIEYLSNIE